MFERLMRAFGRRDECCPAGDTGLDRQGDATVPAPVERETYAAGGKDAGQAETSAPLADHLDPGEWPDDPDVVPAWRLRAEAAAAAGGYQIVPYRTRREWESARTLCRLVHGRDADDLLPALLPEESAKQFRSWLMMQASGELAPEYSNEELSAAYKQFCAEEERQPSAENNMRRHLRMLPGIERVQVSNYGSTRTRVRNFVWLVVSPETLELDAKVMAECAAPQRVAA